MDTTADSLPATSLQNVAEAGKQAVDNNADSETTKPKGTDAALARRRDLIAKLVANAPPPRLSSGDSDGFVDLSSPTKKSASAAAATDPEAVAKAEFRQRFERHAAVPNNPRKLMHSQSRDIDVSIMRVVSLDESEQQAQSATEATSEAAGAAAEAAKPSPLRVERQTLTYHQAADRDSDPSSYSREAFERHRNALLSIMAKKRMQALEERRRRYEEFKKENQQEEEKKAGKQQAKKKSAKTDVLDDDESDDEEYEPGADSSGSSSSESDSDNEEPDEADEDEDKDDGQEEAEEQEAEQLAEAEDFNAKGQASLAAFSQDSLVDLFSNSNTAASASAMFGGGSVLLAGQRLPSQLPDTPQPTQYRPEPSNQDDWFSTQDLQRDPLVQSQLHFDNTASAQASNSQLTSSSGFPGFTPSTSDNNVPSSNPKTGNVFPDFITQAPLVTEGPGGAAAKAAAAAFPDFITQTDQLVVSDDKDSGSKTGRRNKDGFDVAEYGIVDSDESDTDDLAKALMISGVVDTADDEDALLEMPASVSKQSTQNREKKSEKYSNKDSDNDLNKESNIDSDKDLNKESNKDSDKDLNKESNKDSDKDLNKKSNKDSDDESDEDSNEDSDKDSNKDDASIGGNPKRRTLTVSSDDDGASDESSDEASETEAESESEADDEANANLQSPTPARPKKLRRRDFFEQEAELSGSDVGEPDDDEDEDDENSHDRALAAELEGMIDDDEAALGGQSKVRREVQRIQQAIELDEDRRRLDQLKELLLPDGEFADETDGDSAARKWRFNRWKELRERRDAAEAAASAGIDDACWGDGEDEEQRRHEEERQEAEARAEQALRIERHKREQFLEQQEQQQQHQMMLLLAAHESQLSAPSSFTSVGGGGGSGVQQLQQHLLEDSGSQQSQFFREMQARVLRETSNSGARLARQMQPPPLPPLQQKQKQQQQQQDGSAQNKRKNFAPIKRTGSFLTRSRDSSASLRQLVAKSSSGGGGGGGGELKAVVAAAMETKAKSSTGVACFSVQSRQQKASSAVDSRKRSIGSAAAVATGNQPANKKMRSSTSAAQSQLRRSSILSGFYAAHNAATAAAAAAEAAAAAAAAAGESA